MLDADDQPDRNGPHSQGWVRLNASGEPCEVVDRFIPFGQWDWGEYTFDVFPLKPGARGWHYDFRSQKFEDREGVAGVAQKGAIDFDTLRAKHELPLADHVLMEGKMFVNVRSIAQHRIEEGRATPGVSIVSKEDWRGEMSALIESLSDDTLLAYVSVHE